MCLSSLFYRFIPLRELKKQNNSDLASPESEKLRKDGEQQPDQPVAEEVKESARNIIVKILKEVGNFTLLKENKMLLMIVISNFFSFLCYFTPFTFIPIRAEKLGLEHYAWIISIIGELNKLNIGSF